MEEKNLDLIIQSFVKSLEYHDSFIKGHAQQVARYSQLIAQKMDLDLNTVKIIYNAALLHDLGKIGINLRILHKKKPLNKKDWEQIKQHSIYGVEIIKDFKPFIKFVPIILYHHERWDGQGYPFGLNNGKIPLGARIVAIADTWSALRSLRPYRQPYSKKESLVQIIKNKGKQFDPEIVDVFLKLLKSREINCNA